VLRRRKRRPSKFFDGSPYGAPHVGAQGGKPVDETARTAARVQAERVVRIARGVKAGPTV
jgi:NAD(P)H dehydrogenase (quinone)